MFIYLCELIYLTTEVMLFRKTLFFTLLFGSLCAYTQQKNSLKLNVAGLPLGIYSLQYERMLGDKISFNNTFFFRAKSDIPFGGFIDNLAKNHGVGLTGIKFEYLFMNESQVGVKGYSPELRFYLGNKKNKPFIGIFGMYEDFDMKVPAMFEVVTNINNQSIPLDVKIPVNFTFHTLSGGILIGKQFRWNKVGLDLVIIGPHIGRARNFFAIGTSSRIEGLTEDEKYAFREKVKDRFGLQEKYFSMEITDKNAEIRSVKDVPFLGIRGVGLNLSYNF